jgi:cation transport ATPase
MELEDIQKIWNEQKGETMYAINESALHRSITKKKSAASRRMNVVELSLMAINSITGIILLIDAIVDNEGFWAYSFSILILLTVLFLALFRRKRLIQEKTFDRSILGELDHAIANSGSIVQISTIMAYFYQKPLLYRCP